MKRVMTVVLLAAAFALAAASALIVGHFLPLRGVLVAFAASAILAVVCGWRFHVRAGGITGDFLGATQQLTDAAILVVLASC